ncbi:hypothetical protein TWF281_005314 [Arthrobotrys megalospora]
MARRLRDLDLNGKYTLLSYLPDARSIETFCAVFPEFRRTYYTFANRFEDPDPKALLWDAQRYTRESVWIAHYRGILNRWNTTTAEVKEAIDQYVAFERRGVEIDTLDWRQGDSCYDMPTSVLQDKMIANHRYILTLYRHVANHDLEKRDATENGGIVRRRLNAGRYPKKTNEYRFWPTPDEEHNIVRALYRLWVLVLMSCEHKSPLDRSMWMGCVMGLWNTNFWECMQIRAVQKIIHDVIQSAVDETIYRDKEKTILKNGIDLAKFGTAFKTETASSSILHDFPSLIPRWFYSADTSINPQKREDHVKEIREFLEHKICIERDVPAPNLCIFDAHCGYYTPSIVNGGYLNQAAPFRRVYKRGATTQATPHRGGLLWIQMDDLKNPERSGLDLNACIWDEWRCRSWGLRSPSFTRSNVSLVHNSSG